MQRRTFLGVLAGVVVGRPLMPVTPAFFAEDAILVSDEELLDLGGLQLTPEDVARMYDVDVQYISRIYDRGGVRT